MLESEWKIFRLYSFLSPNSDGIKFSEKGIEQLASVFTSWDFTSSLPQMFFKIGGLKNLAIFTGKHLC